MTPEHYNIEPSHSSVKWGRGRSSIMSARVYLMYHELELPGRKLCEGFSGHYRYAIPLSDFRRQTLHLKDRNWRGMSVSEALADLESGKPGVAITFDDGSETDLIGAAPLLKESGFNATFYVVAGWLGKRGYLSPAQLRELANCGFEIGCHSMTHATLNELNPTQLRVEISDAKQKLEDILGRNIDHFSAPGGFWSRRVAQMATDAGYRSVATSQPGVNLSSAPPFRLARVVVLRSTSVRDLERLCTGKGLFVRQVRETALQVPKRLLGYSKYQKLHLLFSEKVPAEKSFSPRRGLATSGSASESSKEGPPVHRALIIDYNVGDGGSAYEVMVAESLAGPFDLHKYTLDFRKWGSLKYLAAPFEFAEARRLLTDCRDHVVVVKTLSSAFLNPMRQPPNIVILHHVGASENPLYSIVEGYIFKQVRKANAVVVVSEYWKRYLLREGFNNVHKIYNGFKMEEFDLVAEEIEGFKKRYGLLGKPIVYVGNYGPGKGVENTVEVLKDLDVHLVASGRGHRGHSQVKCYFLGRRDYLRLLAASEIAITMSQFAEGWCRTAHEAMLCGTPVLGSGLGGMRELLEEGGQIVCPDFRTLRCLVEGLLANEKRREELGRKGREFAGQFTCERFQLDWIDLVNKIRSARSSGSPSNGTRGLSSPTPSERSPSSEIIPC